MRYKYNYSHLDNEITSDFALALAKCLPVTADEVRRIPNVHPHDEVYAWVPRPYNPGEFMICRGLVIDCDPEQPEEEVEFGRTGGGGPEDWYYLPCDQCYSTKEAALAAGR